jgi:hypothetical protein
MSKKIPNYTLEELADAHIIPAKLSTEERAAVDADLHVFRMRILAEMTEQDRLKSNLCQLRGLMRRDLNQTEQPPTYTFESVLKEYLRICNKKQITLAQELQLSSSKLNLYLSGKEHPNLSVLYRLEKHSGGLIPALLWWQVAARKIEQQIQQDTENRQREGAKVQSILESGFQQLPIA